MIAAADDMLALAPENDRLLKRALQEAVHLIEHKRAGTVVWMPAEEIPVDLPPSSHVIPLQRAQSLDASRRHSKKRVAAPGSRRR